MDQTPRYPAQSRTLAPSLYSTPLRFERWSYCLENLDVQNGAFLRYNNNNNNNIIIIIIIIIVFLQSAGVLPQWFYISIEFFWLPVCLFV
jgi:hypothetical protein